MKNPAYVIIPAFILVLGVASYTTIHAVRESNVLGASTGPIFLAKDGEGGDDSGSGSGGGSDSGSGSNSGSGDDSHQPPPPPPPQGGESQNTGSTQGGAPPQSGPQGGQETGTNNSSESDKVLCTGPDGKQFQTSLRACNELNSHFGQQTVFTDLSKSATPKPKTTPTRKPSGKPDTRKRTGTENRPPRLGSGEGELRHSTGEGELRLGTGEGRLRRPEQIGTPEGRLEDGTGEAGLRPRVPFNLKGGKGKIELKKEGENVSIKTKNDDGTEQSLSEDEAFDQLNQMLEEQDLELQKSADNNITIKNGDVEAESDLPVGVDPSTNQVTVETSQGSQDLNVQPQEAVDNLLNNQILSNVEQKVATDEAGGTPQTTNLAQITELQGKPVFKIKGVKKKKLFGVIPVAFQKTVFSSADTGKVVQTDETALNKLLEALSL